MTPERVERRVSRAMALRLASSVLPSAAAVLLVFGLFYYGKIGREAPGAVLAVAAALTAMSIVIAWSSVRYVSTRIARLARATGRAPDAGPRSDEFDQIERAVGHLGSALSAAEAERAKSEERAAAHLREEATMTAAVAGDALAQLDEVRLPLHILLESRFGELNENQEELLRDARAAADAMDVALRRLATVADVDRDALPVQREQVQVNDVVRAILPLARAAAERNGGRAESVLEPGLPRVVGDRARLAEALTLLATDAAGGVAGEMPLVITTARDGARASIRITPVRGGAGAPQILASRLVAAQGGELSREDGAVVIRLRTALVVAGEQRDSAVIPRELRDRGI